MNLISRGIPLGRPVHEHCKRNQPKRRAILAQFKFPRWDSQPRYGELKCWRISIVRVFQLQTRRFTALDIRFGLSMSTWQ